MQLTSAMLLSCLCHYHLPLPRDPPLFPSSSQMPPQPPPPPPAPLSSFFCLLLTPGCHLASGFWLLASGSSCLICYLISDICLLAMYYNLHLHIESPGPMRFRRCPPVFYIHILHLLCWSAKCVVCSVLTALMLLSAAALLFSVFFPLSGFAPAGDIRRYPISDIGRSSRSDSR
jgi:hypothetical protein